MKIFKLARAELKKIFLRPIMVFVAVILISTLSLLTMTFDPTPKTQTLVNITGSNVQTTYNNFLDDSKENGKTRLDKILTDERDKINEFILKIENEDQINTLAQKISVVEAGIHTQLTAEILAYYKTPKESTPENVKALFTQIKTDANAVVYYLNNDVTNDVTFYMTSENYDSLSNFFSRIAENIPNTDSYIDEERQFKSIYEFLRDSFSFSSIADIVTEATTLPVNTTSFGYIIEKFSTNILDETNIYNTEPKLNKLMVDINAYVQENADSSDASDLETLNTYFSKYKSIVIMSTLVLENEFQLAKAGTKTDAEVSNYIGFTNFNSYNLKQESNFNTYLLDNEKFDYDYLSSFSYNQNSGQTTNAFDYTVYTMQALTFIIAIFSIYIASGTIANEQYTGTMKMIAIRPYSRSKIIAAKLLSVLNFMFMLTLISMLASFAIGYISYGVASTNVLVVFNAGTVFEMDAFLLLAAYFASIYVNVAFYIVVAMLFSVLVKSNTISIIFSMLLYGLSLIGNSIFVTQRWFIALPIAHLNLYRYFGITANTGEFFGFTFPIGADFFVSVVYLSISILFFYIVSNTIFKNRNIA